MHEPSLFARKSWSPYAVGAGIGMLSWFALVSAEHLLGITSAFENTAALLAQGIGGESRVVERYVSAQEDVPKVDWEWMLVLGVFIGAFISSRLSGDRAETAVPRMWTRRFGPSQAKRMTAAFLGGAVMMLGARIAEGCTSGHGISGSLQLAVSSLVFVATFFVVGAVVARLLYGNWARHA